MEGEEPVLGDENNGAEGELAPENGTQGSAQWLSLHHNPLPTFLGKPLYPNALTQKLTKFVSFFFV